MSGGQPFMYDPVPRESSRHPYNSFDPKAVTRASLTPKAPKPKQEGPLVSFNQHPDSYLVLPYSSNAKPMNPSIKTKIKVTRIIQMILRCIELLGACGLLVTMILVTGVDPVTAWLMRIPAGFGILHTVYAVYHLGGRASRRPPASSASYMLFAACFDVSLIPFYAFGALMASAEYKLSLDGPGQDGEWSTLLPAGQKLIPILSGTAFLCSVTAGGLHLISLVLSLWLAVTFRKITKLPPDMNPLEDNLTSRHKRNKSSISASTVSEKRLSDPLESKRSSGAPYEDVSRPPTIPFLQTRSGSVESFSTYRTTPPASRDGRLDLPSRQYQVPSNNNSPRSSVIDLKRSSLGYNTPTSPPKRGSYTSLPVSDVPSPRSSRQMGNMPEAWHTAESFPSSQRSSRSSPRKSTAYQPLQQRPDGEDDISLALPHPNPLEANPPTPRMNNNRAQRGPALVEISYNNNLGSAGDLSVVSLSTVQDEPVKSGARQQQQQQPLSLQQQENFKARFYGDLKPATPPILIGAQGAIGQRQVSSGNDFDKKGYKGFGRRNVSGKIAEEGRSVTSNGTWGTRFRKISGKA